MSHVILHIGTQKTGSSALHRFFYENHDLLNKQGVAYPVGKPGTKSQFRGPAFWLRFQCFIDPISGEVSPCGSVDQRKEELLEVLAQDGTVLLSEERFWDVPNHFCPFESVDAKRLPLQKRFVAHYQALVALLQELGAESMEVVVYLRRQDAYVSSLLNQRYKGGETCISPKEFCREPAIAFMLDYASRIQDIENAVGPFGRVVVRRYEKNNFEGGDIFHDFCKAAGIAWDDGFSVPSSEVNPSFPWDAAEALRFFVGAVPPITPAWRSLRSAASELTADAPDPAGISVFAEQEARAIVKLYEEGNQWIAELHFGGGALFSDDFSQRVVWKPDKKRIRRLRTELAKQLGHRDVARAVLRHAYRTALPLSLRTRIGYLRKPAHKAK